MKLDHGLHLGYCTNIHRGETWAETFASLKEHTLLVRERVCPEELYGIGLRLSNRAAHELNAGNSLLEFKRWLAKNRCYIFTINGFPYGRFHGERVKEQVYRPDWTSPERVAYTNLLFDLLSRLLPPDVPGSVSTLPGSFKGFSLTSADFNLIRANLWQCVEHMSRLHAQTGRKLHLGLEPEPMCTLETSGETIQFFDALRAEHRNDPRLNEHLGVNYDTCHFAVEFEEPVNAIALLQQHEIKLSKIHLSNALTVKPTAVARQSLRAFADDVYLHQVVVRRSDGQRIIYPDLSDALASEPAQSSDDDATGVEWRIHFHIPLHSPPTTHFGNTADHLLGVLDLVTNYPNLCLHLEMETYTWEVLPAGLKDRNVVDQLAAEYEWTMARLKERGVSPLRTLAPDES